MYPTSPYNKIENGFTHLKDPAYLNINVTRLAGDDALPYGQKPFYMKMESKSEDFLFLPDIVQGCPKLAGTIQKSQKGYHTNLRSYMLRVGDYLKQIKVDIHKTYGHFEWSPEKISEIFEAIRAEYYYTGKLRSGFTLEAYRKLSLLHAMTMISKYLTYSSLRVIHTHHLAEKINNELQNKATQPNYKKKLVLLSGEERNMLAMLNLLRGSNYGCYASRLLKDLGEGTCLNPPEPGSSLIIELLRNKKDYSVRILYNGSLIQACPYSKSKFERTLCPLKTFQAFLKTYGMTPNFFKMCDNDESSITEQEDLERQARR